MNNARQSFGVCQFNDKYIFAFGGKVLKEEASIKGNQPFSFVSDVEVYDIERKTWKSINYISELSQLRLLNPGVFQVTGKKIMIFGGAKPIEENEVPANPILECGQKLNLSNETLFFNVTNGEIKRGPDMIKPTYFISGGQIFPQQGKIHAFGFTTSKETGLSNLAAESISDLNPSVNKKSLHFYKVAEEEWNEVHESIFTGQRRMSLDISDETFWVVKEAILYVDLSHYLKEEDWWIVVLFRDLTSTWV